MNLNINSQILAEELRHLNKIVPSKPTIQILSHILFRATEGNLSFYATDLELGLLSSVTADVREPGELALPAQKMLSLVEQFPDDDVSIMKDKTQVVVRCGKFTSRLQVLPTFDFPKIPQESGKSSLLSGQALSQAIDKTIYAIVEGGPKYITQGALLTLKQNGAAMIATDGKRLAVATMQLDKNNEEMRVIVPLKTLNVLTTQLGNGEVTMTNSEKHLFFRIENRLLISRMIDGSFPRYEAIIPRENDKKIAISKYQFASALRRVNLVSGDNKAVNFEVTEGQLKISSSSVEVGSADEVVEVHYSGPDLKICVNGDHVLDFANTAIHSNIVMALKDSLTAMMLLDGDSYVGVIMLLKS